MYACIHWYMYNTKLMWLQLFMITSILFLMQMLTNVSLVLVNVIKIVTITLDHTHALVMLVLQSTVMDCIVMVIHLDVNMLLYVIVIGPLM